MDTKRIDWLAIAALALFLFMLLRLLGEGVSSALAYESAPRIPDDPNTFASPYKKYVVSQGLHDFAYGHMAVDIVAGQGAAIHSPIYGEVAETYVDGVGNTTLVLENARYKVTLLHGDYVVEVGQPVQLGEVVGYESNHGYTIDAHGVPCAGRNCGYHTHLNVFDKEKQRNVNPLVLMGK